MSCTPVVVKLLLVKRSDAHTIARLDPSALVGAMLVVTSEGGVKGFRIRQVAEIVGREIRFTTEESVYFESIAEDIDIYWRSPCLIRDLCTELWDEGAVSLEHEVVQRTVERLCSAIGEEADPQMLHELMQELMSIPYDKDLHERAVASWRAHMRSSKINETTYPL